MTKPYQMEGRDYQILFLGLFLGLGIYERDWSFAWITVPCLLLTCLATQTLWQKDKQLNWKSPTITALGLSLLLRSNHLWVIVLAGVLAISSKFVFQIKDKHWFNPANFGIVTMLCLTKDAWVSPGQWGDDLWLALVFLSCGGLVLQKVGRLDTTCAFLGGYGLLVLTRDIYLGWTIDVFIHQMMSGSLLLFALFMLTDPRSIPNSRQMRIVWSLGIAILAFIFQFGWHRSDGIFYALFLASPLTILCDRLQRGDNFSWQERPPIFAISNH